MPWHVCPPYADTWGDLRTLSDVLEPADNGAFASEHTLQVSQRFRSESLSLPRVVCLRPLSASEELLLLAQQPPITPPRCGPAGGARLRSPYAELQLLRSAHRTQRRSLLSHRAGEVSLSSSPICCPVSNGHKCVAAFCNQARSAYPVFRLCRAASTGFSGLANPLTMSMRISHDDRLGGGHIVCNTKRPRARPTIRRCTFACKSQTPTNPADHFPTKLRGHTWRGHD